MISPKLLKKNRLEHFFPPPVDKREILLFNVAQKLTKKCFNDRALYWNTLTYLTSLFRKSPLELMLLSHCEIFNSILKVFSFEDQAQKWRACRDVRWQKQHSSPDFLDLSSVFFSQDTPSQQSLPQWPNYLKGIEQERPHDRASKCIL